MEQTNKPTNLYITSLNHINTNSHTITQGLLRKYVFHYQECMNTIHNNPTAPRK